MADDPVFAVSDSADFPSMTWTFRIPKGTRFSGGVFRIAFERPATAEDLAQFDGLPGPKCPHCGKDAFA